jgi:hypothetical protein
MTSPTRCRYRSGVRNDWPYTGAFVVQLGPETDIAAGRLVGRVEHIASTRSARFASLEELLAAFREMLADTNPPGPDGGPPKKP